jgi:hypothetical protein
MVVYIPIYHCIMKLEQIWTNELLIGIHFHFEPALSQCYNYEKNYKGQNFMIVYLWIFAHVKRQPWKKNIH